MAYFTLTIPKPLCFFGLAHLFAYCYHGNCVEWVGKVGRGGTLYELLLDGWVEREGEMRKE